MYVALGSLVAVSALSLACGAAHAGETERIGGSGGLLVRMDCGANSFLTGVSVTSGSYTLYDMVLLRRLRFGCREFNGSTPSAYETATDKAVQPKYGLANETVGGGACAAGHAMRSITVKAGIYIDRLVEIGCRPTSSTIPVPVPVNVGGNGGTTNFISCPSGEALYRVDVRADDAIDSLQGFCRRFPPMATDVVAMLAAIHSSFTPKPPVSLPASGVVTQLVFTVPDTALNKTVRFVVNAVPTANAMTPFYRMEFVDPVGKVVRAQNAVNAGVASITLSRAGKWKLLLRNQTPGSAIPIQSIGLTQD